MEVRTTVDDAVQTILPEGCLTPSTFARMTSYGKVGVSKHTVSLLTHYRAGSCFDPS